VSVIPSGPFGERVAERLREAQVIWFTSVGADGTPQPNPVWFLWDGETSLLIYSRPDAQRLRHLAARPRVSLNLDGNGHGGDIVVLAGTAVRDDATPAADANQAYLAKYRADMERVSGDVGRFAADYGVPVRVEVQRIRGH
jgi:PPOX class probable F420-dependent enzyme